MSIIALETLKQHLKVTHSAFDARLQRLLDGAEDEALQYLNRDEFPFRYEDTQSEESDSTNSGEPDEDAIAPAVLMGVLVLAQANYDPLTPDEQRQMIARARDMLHPYRLRLGV